MRRVANDKMCNEQPWWGLQMPQGEKWRLLG